MYDIVLLTESRYENPKEADRYVENILLEDRLVAEALERKGLRVGRFDWAGNFDWTTTKFILFRTTWDYFYRFDKFSAWLDSTSAKTHLIHSEKLVRWNMDKQYLLDLKNAGINIPPTIIIKKGEKAPLSELYQMYNFTKSVLKPTFSGAARHTYLMDHTTCQQYEAQFRELILQEDMMLQEFQENIVSRGEVSMMLMGGQFTHAIIKKAKKGDFRVQDDFGGTVDHYSPTNDEIAFAEAAFAACPQPPLYGRADIFYDNDGKLAIGELELIEPELWFRFYEPAADVLADAIVRYIQENV